MLRTAKQGSLGLILLSTAALTACQRPTAQDLCNSEWRSFDTDVTAERDRVRGEGRVYIEPGSEKLLVRFRVGQQYNPNGDHLNHQALPVDDNLVIDDLIPDPPQEPYRSVLYPGAMNVVGDFQNIDALPETSLAYGNSDLGVWVHNNDGPGHAFFHLGGTGFCPDGEFCGTFHRMMGLKQGFTKVPGGELRVFRSSLQKPACTRSS